MLNLIQGGFHSGAEEKIRSEIKNRTKKKQRSYLLVPEQQTVIAEAEMAELLGDEAPLYFEVTNFTRLTDTVFRSLGGISGEYCDNARRALIMWKTLTELSCLLSMTESKREVGLGLVERALGAVAEMQNRSISAEELVSLCERIPKDSRRLEAKISDLSKIIPLYKKLLSEKYSDSADDIDALCEKLKRNPDFFKDTAFFIEGFTSFTEPQYRLIGILSRDSELSVSLPIPRPRESAFEYTELSNTKERLLRCADKHGAKKRIERLDGREGVESLMLSECCDLLWQSSGSLDKDESQYGGALRIFEAKTPYDECDFVAADIREKVARGATFRDFAIIARRAEDYVGVLDSALSAADIPHFISKKRDLSSFEAIKLIYSAIATVCGGFKREDVISYAKCGLCSISRDECDEFELYTDKWQINGKRFLDGNLWNMNPDGYTTRRRDDCDERLLKINSARERLLSPLIKLKDMLSGARTVKDYAEALIRFLVDIRLEEALLKRADELYSLGESESAELNGRLWEIICSSLDVLVEVLGDSAVDSEGFTAQLKTVFGGAEISRIPAFFDEVTVGSADMIRLKSKKHIYMLGVNRGEFPMAASESSYFTDKDKQTLAALGAGIEPDLEERQARELFIFSRAFSYATSSVTLLFSDSNLQFAESARADVIDRIIEITNRKILPIPIEKIKKGELIYSPEQALASLGELDGEEYASVSSALTECGYKDKLDIAERRIENDRLALGDEALKSIYKGDLALTQSKIDLYTDCPLAYFCRYNLKLSEDERAEFNAHNIGSFIHAILESFFADVEREKINLKEITDRKKQELVAKGAKSYLSMIESVGEMRSKRTDILLNRLCRATLPVVDGLCDEFKNCSFIPRFFELKIDKNDKALPEPAEFIGEDGKRVYVYGSIDRVDTYEKDGNVYVRVVDYKTGKKVFSPSDIEDGKNLQMFLYLKSIVDTKKPEFLKEIGVENDGKLIPAGVIYVKAEIGDVKIDRPSESESIEKVMAAQGRQGMILDDPVSIAAMNTSYIPVKFKKDGTPEARSKERLYSYDGWESLCDKMNGVISDVSKKMRGGDIQASPMVKPRGETPCEYCKFKPICRNAKI